MQSNNVRLKHFVSILFLVGAATFVIHEFFHWLAGTLLGYPMRITPNQVGPLSAMIPVHLTVMTAAGPIATYIQAVVGYALVRSHVSLVGFAMVYMAFFMRLVAMGVSVFHPNDEARISQDLGFGLWTLPALAVSTLFILVYSCSRRMRITAREQFICYVVASVVVTTFVGADFLWFGKT
jgi:ABC-type proline/glycine betaine transport system permease subunit